jgi:ubiquitin conjugation factor E4 B
LDFFVRFVALLLNDVTFVLDESFSSFANIHELTLELRSPESMPPNVRQEKEEALSAAQSKAKSYMSLTKETVAMLKLFTEALAESFTVPEIVQRLADMLDYNLDALVGPKQSNLKLENPQEYGWSPHQMLSDIIDVYLNLKEQQRFRTAVARDGRSYKPENFITATRIAQRHALKSPEQIAAWDHLAAQIALAKAEDEEEEEDYGDVPDEYLDPLVYTIMEDPVILPASRVTIDRSTIRSHLLSDPNDPFNRMPLKVEDVIPNTELKEKIEAYKRERKAERAKRVAAAKENLEAGQSETPGDAMDTT